jgi:hypothetical protein
MSAFGLIFVAPEIPGADACPATITDVTRRTAAIAVATRMKFLMVLRV